MSETSKSQPEIILGIDLGTTNSEVAVLKGGQAIVLEEDGDPILPSIVGLDLLGKLLVGKPARNQFVLAPERTIRSIKRKMGQDVRVTLGDKEYSPQEISAIILRTLKDRAEKVLETTVSKAVITVPAFFTEGQREATREAGRLAGLDVVRIINEPTAAVLTYNPHPPEMERLLVYDLGGGTFDVSIAQVEQGVVEILASHGDTQLGGDDFDQLLLDHVCKVFQEKNGIDLQADIKSRSRMLHAVEEAKKLLSFQPVVTLQEEFIAEKDGVPVHLNMDVMRTEYEDLIRPLLNKTLDCLDRAMIDAKLQANQISKVLLVGGATRTPLIRELLSTSLGRPVHAEIEPDLAVAMGAAVQGGLIAGVDVGPVLVDITPHSLGVECLASDHSGLFFSSIIDRNTPLPAQRTEVYFTAVDNQERVHVRVFQGENYDPEENTLCGEFMISDLAKVPSGNEILVKFDLDLNGLLKVTATERSTGKSKYVVIDNMMEKFRKTERVDAVQRLDALFGEDGSDSDSPAGRVDVRQSDVDEVDPIESGEERPESSGSDLSELMADALVAASTASTEDAAEIRALVNELALAIKNGDDTVDLASRLDDLLFYLEDEK